MMIPGYHDGRDDPIDATARKRRRLPQSALPQSARCHGRIKREPRGWAGSRYIRVSTPHGTGMYDVCTVQNTSNPDRISGAERETAISGYNAERLPGCECRPKFHPSPSQGLFLFPKLVYACKNHTSSPAGHCTAGMEESTPCYLPRAVPCLDPSPIAPFPPGM